jgi:hypothetical protein
MTISGTCIQGKIIKIEMFCIHSHKYLSFIFVETLYGVLPLLFWIVPDIIGTVVNPLCYRTVELFPPTVFGKGTPGSISSCNFPSLQWAVLISLSLLCDPLFSSACEWDHLVFLLFNLAYYSYDIVLQLHRHYQNGRMPVFLD